MKALLATLFLLALGACTTATGGADGVTPRAPRSAKALPVAPLPPPMPDGGDACAADVKQCADGSAVSRNPEQGCAFDPCPGEATHN